MSKKQDSDDKTEEKIDSHGSQLLIVMVIFSAILVVGGYFGFQYAAERFDEADVKAEKAAVIAKQAQEKLNGLEDTVQNLQDELQKSNLAKTKYWSPIVIEHLIRMANLTLNTTGDTKLAVVFLETAREYTKASELSAVDNALSNDIASLQSVVIADQTELILKIEAIAKKIESLPLAAKEFVKTDNISATKTTPVYSNIWQKIFYSVSNALSDVVSVRHQATGPLLLPEQENILRLNISAKLLEAEFAVMQKQNGLYQASLDNVAKMVEHYFAANNVKVTDLLSSLEKLKEINLQPKLPSLTASISAVMDIINDGKDKSQQKESTALVTQSQNEGVGLQ